jgi:hypothetical protein
MRHIQISQKERDALLSLIAHQPQLAELHQRLSALEFTPSLLEQWFIAQATYHHGVDGELEFDDSAVVSINDEGSAYVSGWIFIDGPPEDAQWLTACPECLGQIIVTDVILEATGKRVALYTPLQKDGFEVNHPDAQENGSTTDENCMCADCKRTFTLAELML